MDLHRDSIMKSGHVCVLCFDESSERYRVIDIQAISSPDASEAAKSGGRTGGSNFSRSRTERAAAPSQAPYAAALHIL